MCCKLQSCSIQKQQEHEDDIVELGDSDDDLDGQADVLLLCSIIMFKQSYHATHTTCGNQKPQEDDSFELGDIDYDTDEQF